MELAWGKPLSDDLQRILSSATQHPQSQNISNTRVIIVGADVVYQKNLFHPLLKTLKMLLRCQPDAECIIGAWSGRSYFTDFCELAMSSKRDFKINWKADVVVQDGSFLRKLDIIYPCNGDEGITSRKINYDYGPRRDP